MYAESVKENIFTYETDFSISVVVHLFGQSKHICRSRCVVHVLGLWNIIINITSSILHWQTVMISKIAAFNHRSCWDDICLSKILRLLTDRNIFHNGCKTGTDEVIIPCMTQANHNQTYSKSYRFAKWGYMRHALSVESVFEGFTLKFYLGVMISIFNT